jgi:glutamate-1-semialdehyde 2,1-aminomutase
MLDYLCIIQARLGSTRFPNKVLQTVGGVPMVKRVFDAAINSLADKVVVGWPERYPDLDENNVLGRFQRISQEFPSRFIIRLTADCPLITSHDIRMAILEHGKRGLDYFNNGRDGFDVQIFPTDWLYNKDITNKEHVLNSQPNTGGLSVNTQADLMKVRAYAR